MTVLRQAQDERKLYPFVLSLSKHGRNGAFVSSVTAY